MFDAVYIINLDRSLDRWAWMRDTILPAIGASRVVRSPAVDGETLDGAALLRLRREGWLASDPKLFLRRGPAAEIACALSHIGALRSVAQSDHGSALILEDDVALHPSKDRWAERAAATFSELPRAWEMWYLYRCLDFRERTRKVSARIVKPWLPLGAAAYAVTPLGARKLLEAILPLSLPIDHAFARQAVRTGRVAAYAASPRLIEPGHFASIIRSGLPRDRFMADGVNAPPEYWPRNDIPYLSREERGEPRRRWPILAATGAAVSLAATACLHLRHRPGLPH